ncbi:hypothetical protein NPIL_40121 [Nephila pilipes]|uniref:Uncharacterized protein n=1 Tax=Nephila pilipes TaxID=299642 RepID=A0A8X6Q1A7_NEPPI|nr:hypothetical protein NPIL_40121 [Nephila pilipes]
MEDDPLIRIQDQALVVRSYCLRAGLIDIGTQGSNRIPFWALKLLFLALLIVAERNLVIEFVVKEGEEGY